MPGRSGRRQIGGTVRGYPAGFGALAARLQPIAIGPTFVFLCSAVLEVNVRTCRGESRVTLIAHSVTGQSRQDGQRGTWLQVFKADDALMVWSQAGFRYDVWVLGGCQRLTRALEGNVPAYIGNRRGHTVGSRGPAAGRCPAPRPGDRVGRPRPATWTAFTRCLRWPPPSSSAASSIGMTLCVLCRCGS